MKLSIGFIFLFLADRYSNKQSGIKTGRHIDRELKAEPGRQTSKHIDKKLVRHTGRLDKDSTILATQYLLTLYTHGFI